MIWRFTLMDTTFGAPITVEVPEPQGWEGAKFIFRRDLKWHGIFFDYTLSNLTFYSEGYQIIKDAYEEKGILATTDLLIEVQCSDAGDYDTFFEGKLNYSNLKFVSGDTCGVSIGIEQTGCLQEFVTRYDQKVNLESLESFDGTALSPYAYLGYQQDMPSKDIYLESIWDRSDMDESQCITFINSVSDKPIWITPSLYSSKIDLQNAYDQVINANTGAAATPRYAGFNIAPIFDPTNSGYNLPITVEVTYDFSGDWVDSAHDPSVPEDCSGALASITRSTSATDIYLRLIKQINLADTVIGTDTYDLVTIPAYVGGVNPEIKAFTTSGVQSFSITVNPDEKLWLFWDFDYTANFAVSGGMKFRQDYTTKYLKISALTEYPDTEAKAFLVNETLSRITESITDDCMKVYSEWYGRTDSEPYATDADGCGSNKILTNGLMIRRAVLTDGSDPIFSVSFKDMFEGLTPIDNIGIGIEDDDQRAAGFKRIRVEDVAYFYQSALNAICAEVKELEIEFDDKRVFSNIECGYKKWESEDFGGRDDFHGKRIYRAEQSAVANTLNIQSNFIASQYSIERTRRLANSTEDWKYDNDTFVMTYLKTVYGYLDVEQDFFPNAGINNGSSLFFYNERITPIRNLLHWFKTIASTWNYEFLTQLRKLKFTSGEANYVSGWRKTANDDCLLEDQSGYLYENQDIDKTTFKDYDDCKPIWMPETISFDYPLTYQQFRTIRNNPYRRVQVTQSGRTWYGWIEQLEYDPNKGMGKWKLIRQYEDNY